MTREQATGIAYDASLEALTNPGAAGDFFLRHRPRSAAAWCAEFSRLAYGDFATLLAPCLADIGFELVAAPFDRRGTQGFLAAGPDFAVLAFRGSDDVAAWSTNLDALPAPWRGGGRVHRGFAEALDAVWPEVEAGLARALLYPWVQADSALSARTGYPSPCAFARGVSPGASPFPGHRRAS